MDFQIKKSEIAINSADARTSRWTGGEKVDVAIKEIQKDKRKVVLSIKLLEENEKALALEKYGTDEGSGKSLPFSNLDKVLEVKVSEQKIRVGLRQTQADPFDYFNDKEKNQTITVKVISTDNKGLTVRPENCEMDFQIKKSEIAINAADARPSRWTGGEKVDLSLIHI